MKEIALTGTTCHVFADVLGALLDKGLTVGAMVDFPEKVMVNDNRLTAIHFPVEDHDKVKDCLRGYDTVVMTYNDNLEDAYTNDLTLKYFVDTLHAAREAGVKRAIVVASPDSEAFFVSDMRRLDDIDWVFISTEGDFPRRAAAEVTSPKTHKAVYSED